jgi:hypothetical protein
MLFWGSLPSNLLIQLGSQGGDISWMPCVGAVRRGRRPCAKPRLRLGRLRGWRSSSPGTTSRDGRLLVVSQDGDTNRQHRATLKASVIKGRTPGPGPLGRQQGREPSPHRIGQQVLIVTPSRWDQINRRAALWRQNLIPEPRHQARPALLSVCQGIRRLGPPAGTPDVR